MLRIMQDWPLMLHRIIDHAAAHHPRAEVVTRSVEGPTHRTAYAEIRARALRVAQRLRRDGIRQGDRVGTLAWSTWRHLEAWFGIAGAGAVVHTVNPRLPPGRSPGSPTTRRTASCSRTSPSCRCWSGSRRG